MDDVYIIGFTGTRNGMTEQQILQVRNIIQNITIEKSFSNKMYGLHGDCVGADVDFNNICESFDIHTICRPCNIDYFRAHTNAEIVADPIAPLTRNKEIVVQCDVLLACPSTQIEVLRSGTWATVRMARRDKKKIMILYPDGMIEQNGH